MTERAQRTWTSLAGLDRADILAVNAADREWGAALPARVLTHLQALRGRDASVGMPVDRLQHSLQCATRAYRDNRSNEYVACALLHGLGDALAPYSHAALVVCVLKPFVSERLHGIVEHHALCRGYYYFHHLGHAGFARKRYRDQHWYGDAAEFRERFDQCWFDPAHASRPLDFIEPAVHEVMDSRRSALGQGCTSIEAAGLAHEP